MGNNNFVLRLLVVAFVGTLSGCPGGGGGDVSLSNAPSTSNPIGISLSHVTMNGESDAQIAARNPSITDNTGNVYYKTTSVTMTGNCSLGVSKVTAQVNGVDVAETATCTASAAFTWSKSFPAGTPATGNLYTIVLKPADSTGAVFQNLTSSQYITKAVVIDDAAPTAPNTPNVTGGSGASLVSGIWQVSGSGSANTITVSLVGPSDLFRVVVDNFPGISVTYTAGATPISFTDSVSEGSQKTYNVVVYDRAGNASTPTSVIVNYASAITTPPGNVTLSSVPRLTSNNNGADAVVLLGTVGPVQAIQTSTTSSSDWQLFTDFIGFTSKNP